MKTNFKNQTEKQRAMHNETNPYTLISNRLIDDEKLTATELLIMIKLMRDSDNFIFNANSFRDKHNVGKFLFDKSMKNLIEYGYIKKERIRGGVKWTIKEVADEQSNITTEEPIDKSTSTVIDEPKCEIEIKTPLVELEIKTPLVELPANDAVNEKQRVTNETQSQPMEKEQQPKEFIYNENISRLDNFKNYIKINNIPIEMIKQYKLKEKGEEITEANIYNQYIAPYEAAREIFIKDFPKQIYNENK